MEDLVNNNLYVENNGIMVFELKNFHKLFNSITYSDFKTSLKTVNLIGNQILESNSNSNGIKTFMDIFHITNTSKVFKLAVNLLNERLCKQLSLPEPKDV